MATKAWADSRSLRGLNKKVYRGEKNTFFGSVDIVACYEMHFKVSVRQRAKYFLEHLITCRLDHYSSTKVFLFLPLNKT